MPTTTRKMVLSVAALTVVAVLSPATASVARDHAFSRIPLYVTPECTVAMAPELPATPSMPSNCATSAPGATTSVGSGPSAPGPCVAVVPLVDDRCEAWTARFDGPAGGTDYPTSDLGGSRLLATSPDSATVFAAGTSDNDPSTAAGWDGLDMDLVVLGFDSGTGASKWAFRLPHADQSFAHDVVADPDGDLVYATSHDYADIHNCVRHPATVAVDQTTGAHAWTVRESTAEDGCVDVGSTAIDPTGEKLFIIATTESADGHSQQTLIARDADTGELLWRATAAPASPVGETGSAVAVSPDGSRVYAGGSLLAQFCCTYTGHAGWAIRAYDANTGDRVLETTWMAPSQAQSPANPPAAMTVSLDGSSLYVVGGATHIGGRSFDITAISFDTASGRQRWLYRYDGLRDKSSFDSVWFNGPLALSADGTRLAIAGYSTHLIGVNLQFDLVTAFLDATDGRALWETRYTSESETNWMPSVALSPDATRVYVAAMSRYAAKWEAPSRFTTLSYQTSNGTVAWTGRHSDGHSFTQGSALTPDGKRFVVTGMTADAGPQTVTGVDWGLGLAAYSTP